MQAHLCNISREVETLRNNQKEMTGIKQAVAEIKIAFDRLRYMKHSQEKGITESENKSMKLLKLKCKEKKIWEKKKKKECPQTVGQCKRCNVSFKRRRKNRTEVSE